MHVLIVWWWISGNSGTYDSQVIFALQNISLHWQLSLQQLLLLNWLGVGCISLVSWLRRRHSESDATVHTVPQGDLQDAPRIKVAGSLDALQQRQHRRSPVAEEKPKPHIARDCPGVKCIALRSHEPHSADELSLSCGGPLIVWKDSSGSDSDEECKARARCLLTGVVGSVPADSFISLKRVKRRL